MIIWDMSCPVTEQEKQMNVNVYNLSHWIFSPNTENILDRWPKLYIWVSKINKIKNYIKNVF